MTLSSISFDIEAREGYPHQSPELVGGKIFYHKARCNDTYSKEDCDFDFLEEIEVN